MTKTLPKTELIYPHADFVDELSTSNAIKLMIDDQINGLNEIYNNLENLVLIVENMYDHLKKYNGRIVYCGAGTSGRIGVQDGSELYPTFGWPIERVHYIIAGGLDALVKSIEGAEDDILSAQEKVNNINLNKNDLVFCITASGNTPFTCEVSKLAEIKKALTISISNNKYGKIKKLSNYSIILDTKAEVITGSTRLKAGTSQKVCMNIISSLIMVQLGFVKNGLMTNLIASNKKLIDRKSRIEKIINFTD